ncbi:hypothetical protein Bca52824_078127 [Brassica carinata]|uniref:Uncharacterized protein n=1 Tax=Brassica carinata TaxID=52824 RepID=A0A8X7PX97_BRACI|nr:hypothetical protein Bca52824_078127 [Brassica carinata]
MYRIPIGGIQMVLGLPGPFRGIRSPTESNRLLIMRFIDISGMLLENIERYKAEIKKLQESEADIKALSLETKAFFRSNGNSCSVTHPLQKSLSNLKTRSHMSNGKGKDIDSQINEKDFADMLEDRTKSLAAVQAKELAKELRKIATSSLQEERKRSESFKEELEVAEESPSLAYNVVIICRPPWRLAVRTELDAKLLEIKQLQMKLNVETKWLEAALEESRRPTSSRVFPDATESLNRNPINLEKEKQESFLKEELEKSLKRLETDLKETKRERDKARKN